MKKTVFAAVGLLVLSSVSTAFADTHTPAATETTTVQEQQVEQVAGVTPDSVLYGFERAIEELQLAIARSEERLATLKAQFALERASEAAVMTEEGKQELAEKATAEYLKLLDAAAGHIEKATETAEKAVKAVEALNEAHKNSQAVLTVILEKAPESAKEGLAQAIANQDQKLAAITGFHAAKAAFFDAKEEFEQAKKELEAARKSGDAAAIQAAEEKVKLAEANKDEMESLKDEAEQAKEEVKRQAEQAEKAIEKAQKQVEKANEKMDKAEEKAQEEAEKAEEKAREEAKKAEEKAREEAKKAEEKAREEAKKAEEKSGN